MRKTVFVLLAVMALVPFHAFAVDGVVLINQSTVNCGGGLPVCDFAGGKLPLVGEPHGTKREYQRHCHERR